MSNKKTKILLKEVLERIKPSKEELGIIDKSLNELTGRLEKEIKKSKINAEIFVGGSFAKNTVIKKDKYDVDVFIRFDKKYNDKEISSLTKKLLRKEKAIVIHGSRDYFRINVSKLSSIEIIPVIKIKTPKEARNITDLSYSHVRYIKNKAKNLQEDIMLAKAFCYANNCYGAESYIKGFSGYALELLVYHYKGFIRFVRSIAKSNKDKIIIDIEKHFKNKQSILMDLNSSKLKSPIILIDPTYKQRNAGAALSRETFERFKKVCKDFIKNPKLNSFEIKKTDLDKIKNDAKKKKQEFILLEIKTDRQEGDIAGSKLLKFHKHLISEIGKFFEIKNKGFNYNEQKSARCFFVVQSKKEILVSGPNVKDTKNVKAFKKKHKGILIKKNRVYAKEKIKFNIRDFVNKWSTKNRGRMKEMSIIELTTH